VDGWGEKSVEYKKDGSRRWIYPPSVGFCSALSPLSHRSRREPDRQFNDGMVYDHRGNRGIRSGGCWV
jgi:hypothetical protein